MASSRSPRSSRKRSSRRANSSAGCSDRERAAASSIARGMPSSRSHSSTTELVVSASRVNPGTTAWVRSTNSRTASPGSWSVVRTGSGANGHSRSPSMRSGCWLVTSTWSPGQRSRRVSTADAAAASTCSQLSSTSSSSRSARWSVNAGSMSPAPPSDRAPTTAAISPTTSCSSVIDARSTNHAPSGNWWSTSAATWSDSRVLPTPPGPTRVTTRSEGTSSISCAISSSRPTKLVIWSGR